MSTRSEVEIRLRANIADAEAKLRKMGSRFDRLKFRAKGLGTALGKMGFSFKRATIAGAAMAAGMAIIINRTLSSIDATAKLSRNLDISMASLAAFSLQARIGGVSTDTMNKSLGKMMKNIGDATLGFGTAKTILDRLNIDFQKLANLSPEDQFKFMADTIAGMTTRAEKLSFATAIFGKQGIALIEVLEGGSEAFQAAARDTKLFGTSLSKVDARKVEEFNDQFTRLKEVAAGAANTLTLRFVEGMKPVIDRLIEGARESGGFKDEVNSLADAFTNLAVKSVSSLSKTLEALKETRQFFARHPILEKIIQIGAAPISYLVTGAEKDRNIVTGSWPDERPQVPKGNTFQADAQKAIDAAIKDDQLRKTRITDFRKEAQAAIDQVETTERKIKLDRRGLAIKKEMRTAQEKLNDRLKELNKLRAADSISLETFSRASEKAIKDFEKLNTVEISNLERNVRAAINGMKGPFTDFFDTTKQGFLSLQSLWGNTMNMLRRKAAEAMADKAIQFLMGKVFPGGVGGGVGGKKGIFGLGGVLGIFHKGGVVGSGSQPTRQLSFAGVRRMHSGGLLSDERLIVGQTEEGMLSRKGMKNLDKLNLGNLGNAGGGGGGITVNAPVTFQISAIDTQTGVEFASRPEILEVVGGYIRQVIIGNGGKELGL